MADITISYKGNTIAELSASGSKTLQTAGKYCEDDISIVYVQPSSGESGNAISVVDTLDSHGGTVRTITAVDISDTTAVASDVATGKYFYTADGTKTEGTSSGGGSDTITPAPERDVNFIDYDGTIVYSYSASDFLALSELPVNPTRIGLTAQGWNWTLANAKTYVTSYGQLDIHQNYVTDDGKTRIYISIPKGARGDQLTFYVRYTQTVSQGVTVDWGDGNSETFTGTSASNRSHTYASSGDYLITLQVTSGNVSFIGTSSYSIFGQNTNYHNRARIYKIELGSNVTALGDYIFYHCYTLETLTIPTSVTSIGNGAFRYARLLKSVAIPSGASVGTTAFSDCSACKSIQLPSGTISVGTSTYDYCYSLRSAAIPSTVTSIGDTAFRDCRSLRRIIIPSSVTSIGASAFSNCYGLGAIYFTRTTAPTVSNSNAWTNIPTTCTIYVPRGYLSAYTGATNYPSSSSYTYMEYDTI